MIYLVHDLYTIIMKILRWFHLYFFILIVLTGCIQEIEVFKKSTPVFVVDGLITNEPGPHQVKLSYSKTYGEKATYYAVEEAVVLIVDDLGNEELLTYEGDGKYITSENFSGGIGRSYQVKITLKNGEQFESVPEKMADVPPIDKVTYERDGFNIIFYIDFQDNPQTPNYYRWRYKDTYEVVAPLAYSYIANPDCHPKDGQGKPMFNRNMNCWVTLFDYEFLRVDRDLFYNGRRMEGIEIHQIEFTHRLNLGYDSEIFQYSLTKRAYTYWNAIEEQMGNNGTIFETPNFHIKGNIYSVNKENTQALGYFGVSAVSSNRVFISDYINQFEPVNCEANNSLCIPITCIDCMKYRGTSFPVKPDFWPY